MHLALCPCHPAALISHGGVGLLLLGRATEDCHTAMQYNNCLVGMGPKALKSQYILQYI